MRFKLFTATSVSIMACSVAYAGGWSTGNLGQSFMSEEGGFGEISVGQVDYKITASSANNYAGGQATNIDVIKDTNRVSLWTDKINFKCPGGTGFGWHQDAPYWMHAAEDLNCLPNVMITLDDVTVDNGAFRVIRGSHLAGNRTSKDDGSQLQGFYTHPDEIDLSESVEFVVPAGTAIIFDPFLIHGSSANVSSVPRRVMIATYQPADCLSLKAKTMINLC